MKQVKLENNMTTLISVYLPQLSNRTFFLQNVFKLIASDVFISAGSFITVLNKKWDASNNKRVISA